MTFDEAIAWWYGRIDFERTAPQPGDLKLDRMKAVLRALGDPHRRMRVVHVAGTKGKGSTSAMLASVLRAAGYRVGLFTSPHLSHVSERIQVDSVPITPDEMAARLTEIADAVQPMEQSPDPARQPTFFEIGTALGFSHFDCRRVDIAVIEVGLGGRFDSTNVCSPLVSVVTNISYDHMQQLGDRLELIAREKAGIIKRRRPVVTTAEAPEALTVIEKVAAERMAPLKALGRDFSFDYRLTRLPGMAERVPEVRIVTRQGSWPWTPLGLYGMHQGANAAGVVAIVETLRELGLPIADNAVTRGLAEVKWPARLEVVGRRPLILLDCAHNVASVLAMFETIRDAFPVAGKTRAILAFSSDKQVAEMLHYLGDKFDHFYLTRYAGSARSLTPERQAELLKASHPNAPVSLHPKAADALAAAKADAGADDLIAISGSVFLAGELRPLLVKP